jgi:hypothetical protein
MWREAAFAVAIVAACGTPRARPTDDASFAADATHDATTDATDAPEAPAGTMDPFAALQAMPGTCTSDGWCWTFPTPTGNRYTGVFATAPDNIWLTGARGTVFQWDGQTWIVHHPPALPGQDFVALPFSITGRAKNDVWLVLSNAVEHWDGATWTIVDSAQTNLAEWYFQIWEAPNGDVWTAAHDGVHRSQGGGPFQLVYSEQNATSVWGTAADDVLITGGGQILHYDGQSFTPVYVNGPGIPVSPGQFMGFKNDVWGSTSNATLMHWDGTSWTAIPSGLPSTAVVQSVTALASNDVWWLSTIGVQHQELLHWDGTAISIIPVDYGASYGDNCCPTWSHAAIIDGKWWIVGANGGVYTKVSESTLRPITSAPYVGLSMWGTSDNDMYFQTGDSIGHWDGTVMTSIPSPGGATVTGVAGAGIGGANVLFALGDEIDWATQEYVYSVLRYDGQVWTKTELMRSPEPFGTHLSNLYAMGADEAMVVGQNGLAFHYKNGAWTTVTTGVTTTLLGIWGPDADHLWISGSSGTLLQWDRAAPDVMTPDPTFPATTNDLGWIHGADGVMWIVNPQTFFVTRHSGSSWSQINTGLIAQRVFALSDENVLVSSSTTDGYIARWNGSEFVIEDHDAEGTLQNVYAPPQGHTWLTDGFVVSRHP